MDRLVSELLGHRCATLEHFRAKPFPMIAAEHFDKLLIVGDWQQIAKKKEAPSGRASETTSLTL